MYGKNELKKNQSFVSKSGHLIEDQKKRTTDNQTPIETLKSKKLKLNQEEQKEEKEEITAEAEGCFDFLAPDFSGQNSSLPLVTTAAAAIATAPDKTPTKLKAEPVMPQTPCKREHKRIVRERLTFTPKHRHLLVNEGKERYRLPLTEVLGEGQSGQVAAFNHIVTKIYRPSVSRDTVEKEFAISKLTFSQLLGEGAKKGISLNVHADPLPDISLESLSEERKAGEGHRKHFFFLATPRIPHTENAKKYFLTELKQRFTAGGHLAGFKFMINFSQSLLSSITYYLHQYKIVHGDLKLDNFLMISEPSIAPEGSVAFPIDYGLSDKEGHLTLKFPEEQRGRSSHCPPECFGSDEDIERYDQSRDIFSLGVVYLHLLRYLVHGTTATTECITMWRKFIDFYTNKLNNEQFHETFAKKIGDAEHKLCATPQECELIRSWLALISMMTCSNPQERMDETVIMDYILSIDGQIDTYQQETPSAPKK